MNTGQSPEDKLTLLEHKLEEIEKLVNYCVDELANRIDGYFITLLHNTFIVNKLET